jgi:hypothetical protein
MNHGSSSGFVTNSPITFNQPVTIIMVQTFPYDQAAATVIDTPAHNDTIFSIGDKNIYVNCGNQFNGLVNTNQAQWQIVVYQLNGASSYVTTNAVSAASGNGGANTFAGICVGMNSSAIQQASFNWAYLVAFTNMSQANLALATNYLGGRFGMLTKQGPITTTVLASQNQNNLFTGTNVFGTGTGGTALDAAGNLYASNGIATFQGNKASMLSSNVAVSPWLWTNPFAYNVVAYLSQTNNGWMMIDQNGTLLGPSTNTIVTLLCQPNEYVWVTNGSGQVRFFFKPL